MASLVNYLCRFVLGSILHNTCHDLMKMQIESLNLLLIKCTHHLFHPSRTICYMNDTGRKLIIAQYLDSPTCSLLYALKNFKIVLCRYINKVHLDISMVLKERV